MPKVFIINKSAHNYSRAKEYGELIFITEGLIDSYNLNLTFRQALTILQDYTEEDYILMTGLSSTNLVVGWVLGNLKRDLNVLLYKDGEYVVRKLTFDNFEEVNNEQ